jgi:hypothetical protein
MEGRSSACPLTAEIFTYRDSYRDMFIRPYQRLDRPRANPTIIHDCMR